MVCPASRLFAGLAVALFSLAGCGQGSGPSKFRPQGPGAHTGTAGDDASIDNEGGFGNDGGLDGSGFAQSDAGADASGGCLGATTCAKAGANCGPIGDGCGHILHCGICGSGETCGGAGTPSVCGAPACTPKTCADLGLSCGPAGDGCGNSLDCGLCSGSDTCGGGGTSGVCGHGLTCVPKTCADQGIECGPAGDGCGNALNCSSCLSGVTCGGGGTPGVCGAPACTPTTCIAGACGPVADGCGGLLNCGTCSLPETCGGMAPSQCGVPATCTNLCLKQVSCPSGATTSLTGTVYAPNGVDPLPNMLVYVPNAPVQPFSATVSCDNCNSGVSGSPLVSATTGPNGAFTLTDMPVGTNIPLVIQTGRWRRQVAIPIVAACASTQASAALTRLPKTQSEGDIPHMAFATGAVDSLECVMRKIGVADTEFGQPGGGGRIDFYVGDGVENVPGLGTTYFGGSNAGSGTPGENALVDSPTTLRNYDMVFFPCQGDEFDRTTTEQTNLINYANAGGRIFATHYSYVWLFDDAPFDATAQWDVGQCDPATSPDDCTQAYGFPPDQTGYIDTSFPKGQTLAQWLQIVKASTTLGQIPINSLRWDLDGINPPSQLWMQINDSFIGTVPMHYTFNTPTTAPANQQCGRFLFDDFHVENQNDDYDTTFPGECDNGPMTPQEKLLEFMIFDLGSCVAPDVPTCTKTTCAAQGISCGPAADGCGGVLSCGSCSAPDTCGGGGTPSQCGAPMCTPRTCAGQGIQCGPAGDGCGNPLVCGSCPMGQTCGGGGASGMCGTGSTCSPKTCAEEAVQCGPAGDGCGNSLHCGSCAAGQTCGGGGKPGVCGSACVPETCQELGFNCGAAGDGCGGQIQCGTCALPQTCGGGGKANVCGGASQ